MVNKRTLLIDNPFALKQVDGKPVYIVTREFKRLNKDEVMQLLRDLKNSKHEIGNQTLIARKNEVGKEPANTIDSEVNSNIDLSTIGTIVITPKGKGFITMDFLQFLKSYDIAVYWVDKEGMIDSFYMPVYYKKTSLMLKQLEAKRSGRDLDIAKYIIGEKFKNNGQDNLVSTLVKAKTISELIGIEGATANKYYADWSFNDKWGWERRRGKGITNARAIDPINCMLNLGYSLLAQKVSHILLKRGWELSIGFFHLNEKRRYWNALSYDFVEPFRYLIDQTVLNIVKNSFLSPDDFTYSEGKSHLVHKEKAFKVSYQVYQAVLDPLEHKASPLIRTVESML
jgi:CRISPR-associated endonuclease Cas1